MNKDHVCLDRRKYAWHLQIPAGGATPGLHLAHARS